MLNFKFKAPFDEAPPTATTIIGAGTTISGDITSYGDIRVDGILNGHLVTDGKVLIGPDGIVTGNITAKHADVLGKITGDIEVKDLLVLKGKAIVDGTIHVGKLQVEPTVLFNGACHMGANIIELNTEKTHAAAVN